MPEHSPIDPGFFPAPTDGAFALRVAEALAVIDRVTRELGRERPVRPADELIRDLQLDSLGLITLVVALEDRFRIRLTEEDGARVVTVLDLAALVASKDGERP